MTLSGSLVEKGQEQEAVQLEQQWQWEQQQPLNLEQSSEHSFSAWSFL